MFRFSECSIRDDEGILVKETKKFIGDKIPNFDIIDTVFNNSIESLNAKNKIYWNNLGNKIPDFSK